MRVLRPPIGNVLALVLAVASAIAIAAQVFLAGMNVFLGPRWWAWHITLGHATGALLLMQALIAWLAWLPARSRWLSLGMVALFGLQYNVRALASLFYAPYLIPLHAVNALFLFWIAVTLAGWALKSCNDVQVAHA